MRESCLDCVLKHIAQAIVLMSESYFYPTHKYLAIGHLAEASDESILEYPDLACLIREERLKIQEEKVFDLVELLNKVIVVKEAL